MGIWYIIIVKGRERKTSASHKGNGFKSRGVAPRTTKLFKKVVKNPLTTNTARCIIKLSRVATIARKGTNMMNSRDFYNYILSNVSDDSVKEFATHKLEQMDNANARRVSKPSKRAVENAPIKENLRTLIGEGCTASDIAPRAEISVQKASALLRQMVADGVLSVEDVKVPKKGMVKFYKVIG